MINVELMDKIIKTLFSPTEQFPFLNAWKQVFNNNFDNYKNSENHNLITEDIDVYIYKLIPFIKQPSLCLLLNMLPIIELKKGNDFVCNFDCLGVLHNSDSCGDNSSFNKSGNKTSRKRKKGSGIDCLNTGANDSFKKITGSLQSFEKNFIPFPIKKLAHLDLCKNALNYEIEKKQSGNKQINTFLNSQRVYLNTKVHHSSKISYQKNKVIRYIDDSKRSQLLSNSNISLSNKNKESNNDTVIRKNNDSRSTKITCQRSVLTQAEKRKFFISAENREVSSLKTKSIKQNKQSLVAEMKNLDMPTISVINEEKQVVKYANRGINSTQKTSVNVSRKNTNTNTIANTNTNTEKECVVISKGNINKDRVQDTTHIINWGENYNKCYDIFSTKGDNNLEEKTFANSTSNSVVNSTTNSVESDEFVVNKSLQINNKKIDDDLFALDFFNDHISYFYKNVNQKEIFFDDYSKPYTSVYKKLPLLFVDIFENNIYDLIKTYSCTKDIVFKYYYDLLQTRQNLNNYENCIHMGINEIMVYELSKNNISGVVFNIISMFMQYGFSYRIATQLSLLNIKEQKYLPIDQKVYALYLSRTTRQVGGEVILSKFKKSQYSKIIWNYIDVVNMVLTIYLAIGDFEVKEFDLDSFVSKVNSENNLNKYLFSQMYLDNGIYSLNKVNFTSMLFEKSMNIDSIISCFNLGKYDPNKGKVVPKIQIYKAKNNDPLRILMAISIFLRTYELDGKNDIIADDLEKIMLCIFEMYSEGQIVILK